MTKGKNKLLIFFKLTTDDESMLKGFKQY